MGAYDETSIITAYDYEQLDEEDEDTHSETVNDVGSIRTTEVDVTVPPRKNFKITNYIVQENDSYDVIAKKFGISGETILWVNDLDINSTLKVGQTLRIPPVSGVIYTVREGDTLSAIASKYKVGV